MKILNGTNDPIMGFNGKPVTDPSGTAITYKEILLQYCGNHQSNDGAEHIMAHAVGQKIYDSRFGKLELEDEEFNLLKSMLSSPAHPSIIMGPVLSKMDEAERYAKERNLDGKKVGDVALSEETKIT